MNVRVLIPAALALAVLAGCGGGTQDPVAAPAAATSSAAATRPTPSPTPPPVLTKQQAGALYLRLVDASNRSTKALNTLMQQAAPDLAAGRAAAAAGAKALRVFSLGLQQARWPHDVQPLIDSLVTSVTKQASYERSMAAARSVADLQTLWDTAAAVSNDSSPTADLIRQKLGLPPPPAVS